MIVVHEVFVAKPGQASKLAGLMEEVAEAGMLGKCRVLTDLTGSFNRVIIETELESLAELEKRLQDHAKNEALKAKMKGYTEMYVSGAREIYRVWH